MDQLEGIVVAVGRQEDNIMGKKGTWFSAVKKAFRSPSKDKDFVKTTPKDLDLVGDLPPLEVPVRSLTRGLRILISSICKFGGPCIGTRL